MATVSTSDVSVRGVRSLVWASGPAAEREAVVFVHGNPGSGEEFKDLVGRAGDFARAVAPDMPGYGKADRPDDFEYSVPAYARHLGGLIEALGIERAHLVLHDYGGPWGLTWASENPSKVASLALINIGIMPGYRWHRYARIWRTPVLGEIFQASVTRWSMRTLMNAENPRPLPREFLDRIYDSLDRKSRRAILRLYRNTPARLLASEDLADKLTPLRLPALVLWGTGDKFVPSRYAEEQRRFFAIEAVHLLDDCGHWPFVDDPEKTASLLLPYLRARLRK